MKNLRFCLIVLLGLLFNVDMSAFEVDGLNYELVTQGETNLRVIRKSQGTYSGDIVIPEKVMYEGTEYSVTEIGNDALGSSEIVSVFIPKSIIRIDNYALNSNPKMLSMVVDVNNPVYDSRDNCNAVIETKTNTLVYGCCKTTIPETVVAIGREAFYQCSSLTDITIPTSVVRFDFRAFRGCSALSAITIPNSVTFIGENAFWGCRKLEAIVIPPSVETIEYTAFGLCPLLGSIVVDPQNKTFDSRGNCNAIIEKKTNTLVVGCKNTIIPETVEEIGSGAFCWATGLTSIHIPESVIRINGAAFADCTSLVSVNIPSQVSFIGVAAFGGCHILESISLPVSVTTIGEHAFSECWGLTSLFIPAGVTSIGDDILFDCGSIETLKVDPDNKFYDSREDCNAIIETKTNKLLVGCQNSFIPTSVSEIGTRAFMGCQRLPSIVVPDGIEVLNDQAFQQCYALSYIKLPASLRKIGRQCFLGCSNLKSITLPYGLMEVGGIAFSTTPLTTIKVKAQTPPTVVSEDPFDSYGYENGVLCVPKGSLSAYQSALPWSKFKNIQEQEVILDDVKINDQKDVYRRYQDEVVNVDYSRSFNNVNWQALYLPFALNYADWDKDFRVARINNIHQYDDNEDGMVDRTVLEVFILPQNSSTQPNTPYLIKAKKVGDKVLSVSNVLLKKSEENSYDCSSWTTRYVFQGTYKGVAGEDMFSQRYYALSGGCLQQASEPTALGGFRWYMSTEDRGTNKVVPTSKIQLRVIDEFGNVTGIEELEDNMPSGSVSWPADIYNLQGKLVKAAAKSTEGLPKGIYIVNGKKIVK